MGHFFLSLRSTPPLRIAHLGCIQRLSQRARRVVGLALYFVASLHIEAPGGVSVAEPGMRGFRVMGLEQLGLLFLND